MQDTLFIAMELLEGESLADRLARGRLAIGDAARISVDMLSALEALHAQDIIHRDLKPSNIFLAKHGIKLLDFGLAKSVPSSSADANETTAPLTRPGLIVGTARYMSPEQARGLSLDRRSDLFAAGAVLFEMLAGRPAFAGDTFIDDLHAVAFAEPEALDTSSLPGEFVPIVRRALSKSPDGRFPSASAMADALRHAVGVQPASTASSGRQSWACKRPSARWRTSAIRNRVSI